MFWNWSNTPSGKSSPTNARLNHCATLCASCNSHEAAEASGANIMFEVILQCRNGRWDQLSGGKVAASLNLKSEIRRAKSEARKAECG